LSGSAPVRAPDIAELETLVICAAEGSLVAAAARLGISRPAVAKRITNLETLAGRPLLDRGGRGVRLTDAGATLLAGARRILHERDLLLSLLTEIRGEGPSPIAGLRELLGSSSEAARAAQQPEARLAETERVLAIILRASATGLVISSPETSAVYEANDAFCRFTGRSRAELLGAPTAEKRSWFDPGDRDLMLEAVRSHGVAEAMLVRARQPDGTLRVGQATSRFIPLAGERHLLTTVDDITVQHLLEVERTAGIGCYRAVTQVSKLLKAGSPAVESIASVLPDICTTGELEAALLFDLERRCPHVVAGGQPPGDLDQKLLRGEPLPGGRGVRISCPGPDSEGSTLIGWGVPLASTGQSLVLLTREPVPWTTAALYVEVLTDLSTLAENAPEPSARSASANE